MQADLIDGDKNMTYFEIEWVPLGSVVQLKEFEQLVVITGRMQGRAEDEHSVMEYIGIPYPTGFQSTNEFLGFNSEQIERLVHLGYADEQELEWCKELTKAKEELNKEGEDS